MSRGKSILAERNNLVPNDRQEARRWTRFSDYWPDADAHIRTAGSEKPGTLAAYRSPPRRDPPKASRRTFVLPALAIFAALGISLWASGLLQKGGTQAASPARSSGLLFGLCSSGGVTNCVASGDSFYLGGKTVRVAGIEAPQLYGAACPREAALGRASAKKLQGLLNSGEIEMTKVPPDLDRYGLLLRSVSVNGKEIGHAMVEAGLARDIGDMARSWC